MKASKLLLLLALPLAAHAQQAPHTGKDSPAEAVFRAYLKAFNTGDRDTLLAFFKDHYPSRTPVIDNEMRFRRGTGGFDFRKSEEATATTFTALVQEKDGDQFARATVEVDPNKPDQIAKMGLRAIPRPAEFAIPRLSEAEALKEFGARLERLAAAEKFMGAALVAHNGKAVFTAAHGYADREQKIPNKVTTRFRMGSMNKMFTATSTLQLVQAGKINLNDPLAKYLPDYPNKDLAAKVTIHHLLTHTGGTGDFFGPEYSAHRLELKMLPDYVKLFGERPLRFEPGARWEYSNYGFILLGLVVQKASGQDYYDYVHDHIFKPAGMTATASEPEEVAVPDRSKGYMNQGGKLVLNTDTLPYRGTSAGGGYTTVEDLLRFANALHDHKLLNEKYTDLLTTGKVESGAPGYKYAYGFDERIENGIRSFGHSGGAPGMNGDLRIFPQSGYVVVALANMDGAAVNASNWISARLPLK